MSDKRRQLMILAVLAVILAAVSARSFVRTSRGGGLGLGGPPRAAALPGPGEEVVELQVGMLEQKPGSFRPGRDPFRFQQPPKPPPAPVQPKPAPRQAPQQAPKQRPAAAAQAPQRPRPPAIDFKYLGSFGPEGGRIAVFSDQAEIYNARRGEVVKEKFVVHEIGYESADIGYVEFPDEPAQRLAVGG